MSHQNGAAPIFTPVMPESGIKRKNPLSTLRREVPQGGLTIERRFTKAGEDPLAGITYELRVSRITNTDGSNVFEMKDVEVPASWTQVATDILAQKYFRKKGIPTEKGGRNGSEWSARQVVTRLAGTWRHWGEKYGYFATTEDAQAFEDEMKYTLITQMGAPNSPQWFNTGLAWAYDIKGEAQGHYYVDPMSGVLTKGEDAYTHPQPHACGRWDTKIATDSGMLNLGHIVEENKVGLKVYDGEHWVKIIAVKNNGVRSLYKMTLSNGQYIEFTNDHLIWAADTREKDGGIYKWRPLRECLNKRVHLAQIPALVRTPVEENVAVKEAAIAGFHIGDGYHGTYSGITHFGVCTNDADEFNHVTGLFKEVFGGYTVTKKPKISDEYRIVRHDFNYTQLFAERYGLGIGSDSVRIHDLIFKAPRDVQAAFLRGLFQADGCVRIRRRGKTSSGDVCLTTISEGLAHDVQNLLLALGIYSRISTCKDKRIDRALQYHIEIAYESERIKFENIIGFISQRKIKKLRELNSTINGKDKPTTSEELITSIEYIGDEAVYDIQTESGKFTANGVVVHNCFIQAVKDDLVNEGGIFDLMLREARLFKYGSGTGSNFSAIRGKNESLSGGGRSSGLMSFLTTIDRGAGAIKSGGTTRRAAKMVCLDIDHPEVEEFVNWKVIEEQKVAALHAGSYICRDHLKKILSCAQEKGIDPNTNPELKKLIKEAHLFHVPLNYIKRILMLVEQGLTLDGFEFPTYDTDFRSEAYYTVAGQNSNNSIRVTNKFLRAVQNSEEWELINRIDGKVAKKLAARKLWDDIAYSAWACADPGIQYDTTINEWHTCPVDGKINASNPCVTGDTLVSTAAGYRRIVDLVGQEVEVIAGDGRVSHVTQVFKTGTKPVFKLTTASGYELKLTADHKVFTMNRGDVPAIELTQDDHVVLGTTGFGTDVIPNDVGELIGLAVGDGCLNKDGYLMINMNRLTESGVLQNAQRTINRLKPNRFGSVHSGGTTDRVATCAPQVVEVASAYAILNKGSAAKLFRDDVFSLNRESQAALLRGLFTSDGTVANYGEKSQYVSLDSTSLELVAQVQMMLLGFGIKSKLYRNRRALGTSTALFPNGKGGVQEYPVQQMHSLRISRSSRVIFEREVGFVVNSPKAAALSQLNQSVATYAERFFDRVVSLTPCGVEDVYDLTEPRTSHFIANGLVVHNCSEYMFLDDTACNLASINLIKFYDPATRTLDVEGLRHTSRLWTMVLEISVLMAQFPSKEIAQRSYDYRTLGLGYANLGTVLMQMGIPYASEEAYALAGTITAIMCGQSYATSAEMAKNLGAFPRYEANKDAMLKVMRNHRRAAYNLAPSEYEGLSVPPQGIQDRFAPKYLLTAARQCWDEALALGDAYGYRNAQVTVIAPTGTIGLVMDCDTTGIEPDFALVKFKKLVGGGYFKIVNQSVVKALKALGYNEVHVKEIEEYVKGHGTLAGCPGITTESLREHGFTDRELNAIELQLGSIFELGFAFNRFVLGDEFCIKTLGMTSEALANPRINMLEVLGFTPEQIEAANEYVCGTMTIEGAPHLKPEHYAVFDCANRCGKKGKRYIPWEAHLRMMAAAQPFISGAISKTINMPEESTLKDVERAYKLSWEYMLKAVALYRDGSKLSQPLNTSSSDSTYASLFNFKDDEVGEETITPQQLNEALEAALRRPIRRKLASERLSITHKFAIGNHEGYLTIGLYEDGTPGEIFIKMSKEGSTLSGIMDALALTISLCLQYGVPLEVIVAKFTHSRFEPSGMTGNRNIPMVKSIVDYIGRYLALKFLSKETAKKYHNEELIDRAYAESNPAHLVQLPLEGLGVGQRLPGGLGGNGNGGAAVGQQQVTATARATTSAASAPARTEAAHPNTATPTPTATAEQLAKLQTNAALKLNNEDAPVCSTCGVVMVRNGACYKCTECGETSGCS